MEHQQQRAWNLTKDPDSKHFSRRCHFIFLSWQCLEVDSIFNSVSLNGPPAYLTIHTKDSVEDANKKNNNNKTKTIQNKLAPREIYTEKIGSLGKFSCYVLMNHMSQMNCFSCISPKVLYTHAAMRFVIQMGNLN